MAKMISLPNIGTILNLIFSRLLATHRVTMQYNKSYLIAWAGDNPYYDVEAATVRW
jgi:hypothetical protein